MQSCACGLDTQCCQISRNLASRQYHGSLDVCQVGEHGTLKGASAYSQHDDLEFGAKNDCIIRN